MKDRFLTISAFAELAGVSQPAISALKKEGKALHPAVVDRKIDTHHASAIAYLKERGAKTSNADTPQNKTVKVQQTVEKTAIENRKDELLRHPAEYLDMTLREIIVNFNTIGDFKELLNTRKTIADITYKELQSEEKQGLLVRKEFVERHVFGMLETMNKQLLRDAVQTINTRLQSHYKTGGEPQEGITIVSEIISKNLKATSKSIKSSLKKAKEAA